MKGDQCQNSPQLLGTVIVLAAQWHGGKTLGEIFVVDSAGTCAMQEGGHSLLNFVV